MSVPTPSARPEVQRGPVLVTVVSLAFVVLWSSGFIAADIGAGVAPPVTVLTWRFLVTGALAGAWLLWRRPRLRRQDLLQQSVIALLTQALYLTAVFCASVAGVSAGTSALVTALQPVLVVLAVALARRRRVGAARLVGLLLGLAGVAVVVAGDLRAGSEPLALLWPVGALLALGAGTLLQQRWSADQSVLTTLALHQVVAALFFTVWAVAVGGLAPVGGPGFATTVLWSGLLSGLGGYLTYYLVIRWRGADHASTLIYLTPAATALWTWGVTGEPLRAGAVVGLVVCAAGVLLFVLRPSRERSTPTRPCPPAPDPSSPPQPCGRR